MIIVKTPFWKTQSIPIAQFKLKDGDNEYQIILKRKDGTRMYPHTYVITKEEAMTYPTMMNNGVLVHMIPLSKLVIRK